MTRGNNLNLFGRRRGGPRLSKALASSVTLKPESRSCLQHLAAYKPPTPPKDLDLLYPLSRSAAVLVALFVGGTGDLYVLLSRRAETLRSFPGDTALPGGRYEAGDRNLEDTARREAFEEVGLPRDRQRIPLLCILEPYISATNLLVTPVVVLIMDPDIRPILNAPEVSALFSHPLHGFLTRNAPFAIPHAPHYQFRHPNAPPPILNPHLKPIEALPPPNSSNANPPSWTHAPPTRPAHHEMSDGWERPTAPPLVAEPENDPARWYYTYKDIKGREGMVRMHRFLTGREDAGVKPVYGLTAAMLVQVAMIGYREKPEFQVSAPGQRSQADRLASALRSVPILIEAVKTERKAKEAVQAGRVKAKL